MKFLLITAVLNNPLVYADRDVCEDAVRELRNVDDSAVCIPAGEVQQDPAFTGFFDLIDRIRKAENQ